MSEGRREDEEGKLRKKEEREKRGMRDGGVPLRLSPEFSSLAALSPTLGQLAQSGFPDDSPPTQPVT